MNTSVTSRAREAELERALRQIGRIAEGFSVLGLVQVRAIRKIVRKALS